MNYNTFTVIDCNARKTVLLTSSARMASKMLKTGFKIQVWNNNSLVETIKSTDIPREGNPMSPYINAEKEYIRDKQLRAEMRNRKRKERRIAT